MVLRIISNSDQHEKTKSVGTYLNWSDKRIMSALDLTPSDYHKIALIKSKLSSDKRVILKVANHFAARFRGLDDLAMYVCIGVYILDWPYRRIAAALGRHPSTVKNKWYEVGELITLNQIDFYAMCDATKLYLSLDGDEPGKKLKCEIVGEHNIHSAGNIQWVDRS